MTKKIQKSISIEAPDNKVWTVLLEDEFTREWYSEFGAGTFAVTDWQVGSKAVFQDNTNSGLIGRVIANTPRQLLSVEYEGILHNGMEDYESELASQVRGGRETYYLTSEGNRSALSIECDMSEDMFEPMSTSWDKALLKVKQLAETA